MKDKRLHPAWWILVGCCVLQGGTLGLVQNCTGIFYSPVCGDLGFAFGDFTFYKTLLGIASCIVLPFVGRILERYDIRVTMSVATVLYGSATMLMGTFNTLVPFYLAGIVQGFAGAFLLFVPAPLILSNWFHKKAGFAIGFAGAFSGVVGVIMNPIGSAFIERHGWRAGYYLFGGICLALVLPVTALLLRMHPEEKGARPYGYTGTAEKNAAPLGGFSMAQVIKSPSFYVMCLLMIATGYCTNGYQVLSSYAQDLGYPALLGASLISASMAANIVSKLSFGAVNDRYGAKTTVYLSLLLVLAGYLLIMGRSLPVLYVASFLVGISMSVGSVVFSLVSRALFGAKDYATVVSITSTFNTALGSISVSGNSALFDAFGSYQPAWILCAVLSAIAIVLAPIMFRLNEKDRLRFEIVE